eukprot:3082024-Pyramimonas_sp.AAC.1
MLGHCATSSLLRRRRGRNSLPSFGSATRSSWDCRRHGSHIRLTELLKHAGIRARVFTSFCEREREDTGGLATLFPM